MSGSLVSDTWLLVQISDLAHSCAYLLPCFGKTIKALCEQLRGHPSGRPASAGLVQINETKAALADLDCEGPALTETRRHRRFLMFILTSAFAVAGIDLRDICGKRLGRSSTFQQMFGLLKWGTRIEHRW